MRTKLFYFIFTGIIVISIYACKKETSQTGNPLNNENLSDLNAVDNTWCKSTQIAWGGLFTWDFDYNKKGLADTWTIDYGGGYITVFKMKYDKFNRLASSNGYDVSGNLLYTTSFTYHGILLATQFWADILNGTQSTTTFTYNKRGEIVREDDEVDDLHFFLTYDNFGNCTKSDEYIGNSLYFSDNYEFKVPAINPLLTVSGVTFMFPYSGVGYFNKFWFSRNLSYVYDDEGNAYETNDFKASRKDFVRGVGNFPANINYFDTVSESAYLFTFEYSCGNHISSPQISNNINGNKNSTLRKPVIFGPPTIVKAQLIKLRKQYAKK